MQGANVQYGAGWAAPAGWLNFDSSPSVRLERLPLLGRFLRVNAERFPAGIRFGDIVAGLPVPDASAKAVYASHVLEHLAYEDCLTALRNTWRILQPGGVFRLIVPDLAARARRYVEAVSAADPGASPWFMRTTLLGQEQRPRALKARVRDSLGNTAHRWMWDEPSLRAALTDAGFTAIRVCAFGDAEDPDFRTVEARDRFVDEDTGITELAMEARRPPGER